MKIINRNQLLQINGGCGGFLEHQLPFLKKNLPTITPDPMPPIEPVVPILHFIKKGVRQLEGAFI